MCERETESWSHSGLRRPGSAPAVCLSVSPASSPSPHLQLRVCLWSPSHQLSLTCPVSSACPSVFSLSLGLISGASWLYVLLCGWLPFSLSLSLCSLALPVLLATRSLAFRFCCALALCLSRARLSLCLCMSLYRVLPPALPGSLPCLCLLYLSLSSAPFHLLSLRLSLALSAGLSRPSSLRVSGCPSLPLCVSLAPPPFPPFFFCF